MKEKIWKYGTVGMIGVVFILMAFVPMSASADSTDKAINLNEEYQGYLSGTGKYDYYSLELGSGYTSLQVRTYGTTGGYDFDLYVKLNAKPTTSSYDARGYTESADETVTITSPQAGTYYIMVISYSGAGNYKLMAEASSNSIEITPLTLGQAESGSLYGSGDSAYFSVEIGSGINRMVTAIDGPDNADFDLYVRAGDLPTQSVYDGRGYTESADETVTITSPQAGTYYIMVNSYSGAGAFTIKVDADGNGDTTAPQIYNVQVSAVTTSGATITWTTDVVSTSTVYYGETTSYGYTAQGQGSSTTHSVSLNGLQPATTYHFKVASTDSSGNTGYSNDMTFTTGEPNDSTPPTISGVSVQTVTSSSAVVVWTTNEQATSVVEYGTTTAYGHTAQGQAGTSHTVTISGLQPATTYHFRVVSADASGNTARGSDRTFTTSNDAPDVTSLPVNGNGISDSLSSTGDKKYYSVSIGAGYASLTVQTYNTGSGYDFDLYIKKGALPTTSSYDARGYTESSNEQVSISSPSSGTYYVMVISYSGSGSYSIKATAQEEDSTPPTISGVSVQTVTSSSAVVVWTTDEQATSVVEYGTTTAYGHTAQGQAGTSHTVTINGLQPATTYHFRVVSADASGNTARGNDRTFTTAQEETPNPVTITLDGSARSGSLSSTGDKDYYSVSVPANKASVTVTLSGPSGSDFDLYVKKGSIPTTDSYDGKGVTESANEAVTLSAPAAGTYYIMVVSYSGSGSYSIKATSRDYAQGGSKIALCIGISDYRTINDLQYADDDAYAWSQYLQQQGYEVTTLYNSQATESAIYNAIDNIVASSNENTWVAITFSGHGGHQSEGGYSSSAGNQYGGQVDGHPSLAFAYDADGYGHGCILDNVLAYHLQGLKSDHVLIFLDHCRSGGMDEVAGSSNSGRYVSEACGWNEYSYDAPNYHQGAWTYWFLIWGLEQQGYSSFEAVYPQAYRNYNSEHYDSHPEEIDHYPGDFMV